MNYLLGYNPKSSGHGSYVSPIDSAIASGATSGVTSGVTTKAPSVVGDNDLEKFEDEEPFQSTGGFGYQGFPEQPGGILIVLDLGGCFGD